MATANEASCVAEGRTARVLYSYKANQEDELNLQVGDIITNIVDVEEGWGKGELNGKQGMFPKTFVEEVVAAESNSTLDAEREPPATTSFILEEGNTDFTEQRVNVQSERAPLRRSLEDEIRFRLRNRRKQELSDNKRTVEQLHRTLAQERQERFWLDEELRQARISHTAVEERLQAVLLSCQSDLANKENIIREQQRRLEEEKQERETLQERLRSLELEIEEERRRHFSIARESQSTVSTLEQVLAEYPGHQSYDWIIHRSEVDLSNEILGKGAWGEVRRATFRGCQVAVKEIHELILCNYNRGLFEREMNIAARCRHPNLLQFIGATNDDGSPLFVTELLDTSLRDLLHQRPLSQEEIVILSLDVAKALNYLHLMKPRPIMHRDISSGNVLLWRRGDSWRAKLSDYGAANFMRESMTVNPGSPIYCAPEAHTPLQTSKVDVYSFGVLLCEMCIGKQPDPQTLPNQIRRTNRAFRNLIERCVKSHPEGRPKMSEIIGKLEQRH